MSQYRFVALTRLLKLQAYAQGAGIAGKAKPLLGVSESRLTIVAGVSKMSAQAKAQAEVRPAA